MSRPYVIRSKFATAEDVAEIYGVPKSRLEKIRKIMARNEEGASRTKRISQGKKRSAGK